MLRFILAVLAIFILLAGAAAGFLIFRDEKPYYDISLDDIDIPEFSVTDIPFHHNFELSRGFPYAAAAVIDVDNDGVDELFIGGGVRQSDGLFVFTEEGFINASDQLNLVKLGDDVTLGAVVVDFDDNGYQDIIVSRESAVWLYRNLGGRFEMEQLELDLPAGGAPLAAAVADLNRDGHIDFFLPIVTRSSVSGWLSGSSGASRIQPRLYINNGDATFYDSTGSAGLEAIAEARQALFLDFDDDGQEDLLVHHTDGTVSTWKNRGALLFEEKAHYFSSLRGDFMGMGAGDYNGDGRVDFLLPGRGETLPQSFLKMIHSGRSERSGKWILLNNKGNFAFDDDAQRAGLAGYELGRGALFTDLNSDGLADLVVSQNHPYWPSHWLEKLRLPGRVFLQNSSGAFAEVGDLIGMRNTGFGVTPLQADFNGDGRPDIVHLNLDGSSRIFLSESGKNNYLIVQLDGTARSLGAVVQVRTLSGVTMEKTSLPGKVLCSDSSHSLYFGLADDKALDVVVEYRNGETDHTSGVLFNRKIAF